MPLDNLSDLRTAALQPWLALAVIDGDLGTAVQSCRRVLTTFRLSCARGRFGRTFHPTSWIGGLTSCLQHFTVALSSRLFAVPSSPATTPAATTMLHLCRHYVTL